eukprot:GSChrysophyteH1.ASY1.ANO1.892.1 assembled CDS
MDLGAQDYANGPASYGAHGTGWIRSMNTVTLQKSVRDLNDNTGRTCLQSFALVPKNATESATETAEIVDLAQKIAAEIGDSEEVHQAASKLQAIQRSKQAKKELEMKREQKRIADEIGDGDEVHQAASKLQAIQRSKKAKQHVEKLREGGADTTYDPRAIAQPCETHTLRATGPAIDCQKFVKMDISESGNKTLLLKYAKDQAIVEVNNEGVDGSHSTGCTPYNYRIDASSIHGKPLGDGWFAAGGGSAFSPDERYAVYVACDKRFPGSGGHPGGGNANGLKGKSYFDIPSKAEAERADESASDAGTKKWEFEEDWGERYCDVHGTVLSVVDTFTGAIFTVPIPDEGNGSTVGQPTWQPFPNQESGLASPRYILAFTQWAHGITEQDTKLGMIYCYQRPCSVRLVDLTYFLHAHSAAAAAGKVDVELKEWQKPEFANLTGSTLRNARSPRFCPEVSLSDGNPAAMLVCVGRAHQLPLVSHGGSFQLFRCHYVWKGNDQASASASASALIMPSFDSDMTTDVTASTFPGLFIDQLPRRCFCRLSSNNVDDPSHGWAILCQSTWGSRNSVIRIDLGTGKVSRLSSLFTSILPSWPTANAWNDNQHSSCNVLDVDCGAGKEDSKTLILFDASSPTVPQRVGLLIYDPCNPEKSTHIDIPQASRSQLIFTAKEYNPEHKNVLSRQLESMKWRIFTHIPADSPNITFESVLVLPPTKTQKWIRKYAIPAVPLLLVPHGGPHGCTPTSWIPAYAYLAISMGAAILHVNYRGSLGFGQASVDSLPGHIGTNDVSDMMQALNEVCTQINESNSDITIDMSKICVVGGSHGGFLSAHLTGQYPETFAGAALRNPVTNLPSMACITDIPDWCHIETKGLGKAPNFGGKSTGTYDFKTLANNVLTDKDLELMRKCSPIAHIHKVITPTLTVLGAKDRRVPYSQGVEWHKILRSKGVKSKMMIFPEDVHSIDTPCSEAEHWVAIKHWFEESFRNDIKMKE